MMVHGPAGPFDPRARHVQRLDETTSDLRRRVENLESTVRLLLSLLPKDVARVHMAGLDGNELVNLSLIVKRKPLTGEDDG